MISAPRPPSLREGGADGREPAAGGEIATAAHPVARRLPLLGNLLRYEQPMEFPQFKHL